MIRQDNGACMRDRLLPGRRAPWILVAGVALMAGACSDDSERGGGRRGPGSGGPVTVEAITVSSRTLYDTLEALGTTRANESVTLTAKVTDTVGKVNFEDGQFVDSGAILIELTSEEEQAQLAEARVNLRDAENQWNRLKGLREQGVVSASDLDAAVARVDAERARLNTIIARLKDRLVRAPFAGLLGFRQVSEGTLITPGTPITTIDDIATIKLDFTVPETALAVLAPGQTVLARSVVYGDRDFSGVVSSVGSRVDPVTRAVVVRAIFDNADRALRPGMLMTVRLVTDRREALVVPESAVIQIADESFVYALDSESQARRQTIMTGSRRQGVIEVLGGLAEGDLVISEGIIKVRDGVTVRLLDDARPFAEAKRDRPPEKRRE